MTSGDRAAHPPDEADSASAASERGPVYSPARWQELQRVVDAALDVTPEARAAYLDASCGGDAELRQEAARLLGACEQEAGTGEPFAAPAVAYAAPLIAALAREDASREMAPEDSHRGALPDALQTPLAESYAVEREIGCGGTATVYLARDLRHKRPVAVKVLHRELSAALGAARFLREIEVTAGLTHPHVLPLHDSGECDGRLYYVMPYVEGETLRARLVREQRLSVGDAVRLLREVASALDYAHRRGVVHRDVKPENILLADGHAIVADFGIARAVHRAREAADPSRDPAAGQAASASAGDRSSTLTSAGTSPGTPAYMAPEQVRGGDAVDHRADLYALGVVAYEALVGAHPFGARSPEEMLEAHLREVPSPLDAVRSDVPPALAALVMRLLAKDPAARPATAEAVLRELEEALATPRAPVASAPRRRRTAMMIAAAVLLLAAAIGGYAAWLPRAARSTAIDEARDARAARGPSGAIHTVAVLPFASTDQNAADAYFSDGLTDELAHALARLPGLRLAGRTSSEAFRGRSAPAPVIGRALGVAALVEGRVRRDGDRLRVNAQLVRAADGIVLWDSVYESRVGDVFAVQDALTRAIVAALAPALGERTTGGKGDAIAPDVLRGTTDEEAYDLYLKGRYYWTRRGAANVKRSIAYYRQAIARDPNFARAHAGLAMVYSVLPEYLPDPADSATGLTMASAARAVALDSTLADAQLALGIALDMQLRFRDALARYRAAVAIDPSSVTGHHWLAMSLLNIGRTDEALVELRHATELDPLALTPASALSAGFLFARRFPESRAAARRALSLDSTFALAFWSLGMAQALDAQPDSAVVTLERGAHLWPDDSRLRSALVLAYAATGRWADASRVRDQLRRPARATIGWSDAAVAELVFGDRTPLVRELTTEAGQRRFVAAGGIIGCNPLLDPLWVDGHFRAAMHALSIEPCPLARAWPIAQRLGSGVTRERE